jgi:hypothetical protein
MVRLLPALLLLAACAGPKNAGSPTLAPAAPPDPGDGPVATSAAAPSGARAAPEATSPVSLGEKPASADAIEGLLRARDADDLPTRAALDAHDDPERALRWLSGNAALAGTQDRALLSLGLYPSAENADFLAAFAVAGRAPSERAAALRGLAAMEAGLRAPHRAVIQAGASDPHRAVAAAGAAAAQGLAGIE